MNVMTYLITGISLVNSTVFSGENLRNHQSSASLAFVRGDFPHKGPVKRKMILFDDIAIKIA